MGSMENRYGLVPPQTGRRKRHAEDGTLGGRYTEVKRNADNVQWDDSQKRILFESEDLESISSDSDSQEVRPGWPPDDMCADSTRCRQSFSEKERQGLQLLSPAVRSKVIKLQRDLEEAKAESRYLRAKPVDSPAVAASHLRFTKTPVPRYDGVSDWDQYREVFEAIVISNGWNDLTAALQLLAHLDGEALNVALLVPEDQRRRPGVLIETLTAHYTSPGRLAQRRRQFEQMTRPPGEDPAVFAIALETLERRAFVDVEPSVRLQLVRDNLESDDSEDDDMLPTEEYWAIPDDGWTLVEKPHAKSRGVRFGNITSYEALHGRVIKERNYYDALDDIVDNSVLLNYQRKVIRNTSTLVEVSPNTGAVSVDVKPAMHVQPDRLTMSPQG